MAEIKCKELCKTYHQGDTEVRALDHVTLDIEPGSFICLSGPSGSGKTTLLNMIGGLDRPSRGEITVADQTGWHKTTMLGSPPALFIRYITEALAPCRADTATRILRYLGISRQQSEAANDCRVIKRRFQCCRIGDREPGPVNRLDQNQLFRQQVLDYLLFDKRPDRRIFQAFVFVETYRTRQPRDGRPPGHGDAGQDNRAVT